MSVDTVTDMLAPYQLSRLRQSLTEAARPDLADLCWKGIDPPSASQYGEIAAALEPGTHLQRILAASAAGRVWRLFDIGLPGHPDTRWGLVEP